MTEKFIDFDLSEEVYVGLFVGSPNNDDVISFDGKMLGLSSSVKDSGGCVNYTMPITGSTPKQITP